MIESKPKSYPLLIILVVALVALLLFKDSFADSQTHTLKAPETYLSIQLPAKKNDYYYNPISDLRVEIAGWACGQRFVDQVIVQLRNINYNLRLLAVLTDSLQQIENSFKKGELGKVGKNEIQQLVSSSILTTLRSSSFSSERDFLERAENMIETETEHTRHGMNHFFGFSTNQDMFAHKIYGKPDDVWTLAKTQPEEPPWAVFVTESCFSPDDLKMMFNAVSAGVKDLQKALESYRKTKTRVLILAK